MACDNQCVLNLWHNLCHNFILAGIKPVELTHAIEIILRKTLCFRERGPEVKAHLVEHSAAPDACAHNLADVVTEVPVKLQHLGFE